MNSSALSQALLTTIAYSDIFDYPLTIDEIEQRLIQGKYKKPTRSQLASVLNKHPQIEQQKGLYFLKNRSNTIQTRLQRARWSDKKWQETKQIKKILSKCPFISDVYVTGSLALDNVVADHDDIDLMVVAKPDQLWLARIWVMWQVIPLGKYRRFASTGEHAWCFNLWLDERHLTLPFKFRSLYTAYEVIQAKSIFEDKSKLKLANPWISEYVWCSIEKTNSKNYAVLNKPENSIVMKIMNAIAYTIQRLYMLPHRTTERVGWGYAFFHPRDTKGWIEQELEKRIEQI